MRISDWSSDVCSSDLLDSLFMAAGAPGEVPPGSKSKKVRDWLFQINKEAPEEALQILGRLLEDLFDRNIEAPWGEPNAAWVEDREKIGRASGRERVCQYV